MGLSKDSKEFLESLNSRGIDYVIVKRAIGRPQDLVDLELLEN
jgi:hypothetical protein